MAVMRYVINGCELDMSAVMDAINAGDLLDTMAALEQALSCIPNIDAKATCSALFHRIASTGALPSEKEIEDVIGQGKTNSAISRKPNTNTVHPNFPMPEKSVPSCPTCHSTRLTKLSAGTRFIDRMFFGVFSPESRAQFRCEDCGYLW